MANAKSSYTGPNQSLIKGAALVGASGNKPVGVDLSAGFTAMSNASGQRRAAKHQEMANQEAVANQYLSEISMQDTSGILPAYRPAVEQSLKGLTNQLYEISMAQAKLPKNSPELLELKQQKANLTGEIQTIVAQAKDLTKNAETDLQFYSSGLASQMNSGETISFMQDVAGGRGELFIVDNKLSFKKGDEYIPYNNLPNIVPQAEQEFKTIGTTMSQMSNKTRPISNGDKMQLTTELKGIIKTKDQAVSLAMDPYLGDPLMADVYETAEDAAAAYDQDPIAFKQSVQDRYMGMYEDTWNAGYNQYTAKLQSNRNEGSAAKNGGKAYDGFANYGGVPTHVASGLNDSDKAAINYTLNNKEAKDGTIKIIMPGSTVATEQRLHKADDKQWYFISAAGKTVPYSEVQKYHPEMLDPYTPVNLNNLGAGKKNEKGKGNEGFGRNG